MATTLSRGLSCDISIDTFSSFVYMYVAMLPAHRYSVQGEMRQASAQELVYQHLRKAILSGTLQAGAPLRQDAIAKQLNVSRIPVRDAIGRLHAEGLVTQRSNRSMVVTELGPAEVVEIFEIRAVLEGLAFRLALPHLQGELLHELDDLLRRMNRVVDEHETWMERHDAFHDYLNYWSGRPRLVAQIRQLRAAVQPYLRLYVEWKNSTERHGYEHEEIVAAVRRGDERQAEELMRGHVMRSATKIAEFLHTMRSRLSAPSASDRSAHPPK